MKQPLHQLFIGLTMYGKGKQSFIDGWGRCIKMYNCLFFLKGQSIRLKPKRIRVQKFYTRKANNKTIFTNTKKKLRQQIQQTKSTTQHINF